MKRWYFLLLVSICVLGYLLFGCSQRDTLVEQKLEEVELAQVEPIFMKEDGVPLPPSGPYKPTNTQLQLALKYAGYYKGVIDGKIGPLTQKATRDFQRANNLKVDGKVGPNTWKILSRYLKGRAEQ